jgi:hypothetical protein
MHYSIPQGLVDNLRAKQEYQVLLQSLLDKGIDVVRVVELIKALFGLSQ